MVLDLSSNLFYSWSIVWLLKEKLRALMIFLHQLSSELLSLHLFSRFLGKRGNIVESLVLLIGQASFWPSKSQFLCWSQVLCIPSQVLFLTNSNWNSQLLLLSFNRLKVLLWFWWILFCRFVWTKSWLCLHLQKS